MDTYSVKQIADMLNTQPETVRRWIRSGKLNAEKVSRKDGHVVSSEDLNEFLKGSPKYAGLAAGAITVGAVAPVIALPLVGGIAATYMAAKKKSKGDNEDTFSKEDIKKYLEEEIERRNQSIAQKLKTVEQIQRDGK